MISPTKRALPAVRWYSQRADSDSSAAPATAAAKLLGGGLVEAAQIDHLDVRQVRPRRACAGGLEPVRTTSGRSAAMRIMWSISCRLEGSIQWKSSNTTQRGLLGHHPDDPQLGRELQPGCQLRGIGQARRRRAPSPPRAAAACPSRGPARRRRRASAVRSPDRDRGRCPRPKSSWRATMPAVTPCSSASQSTMLRTAR